MPTKTASAQYQGFGKDGKGRISTQSGALSGMPYGFNTRFEDEPGSNPEELIAAGHASCFTMALSFALADTGHEEGTLDTEAAVKLEKDGDGFTVTRSDLTLKAKVAGIAEDAFADIAKKAKETCPISKLLDCEITLDYTLES